MWDEQRRHRLLNIGGMSWPKRKYVTDAHCALIQMCRHSLKVHNVADNVVARAKQGLSLSVGLSRACTANAGCTVRISSAGN